MFCVLVLSLLDLHLLVHFSVHFSVHLHFTENHIEQFPPPVWNPGGFHINVSPPEWLRAVKVEPGVEERRVLPGDDPALLLRGQPRVVQLLLVRDVDAQAIQVINIVGVRSDFICKCRTI